MVVITPLFTPLTASNKSISPLVLPHIPAPVAAVNQNAGHAPFSNGIFSALNAIILFGSKGYFQRSFKLSLHWLFPFISQPEDTTLPTSICNFPFYYESSSCF